MDIKDIIAIAKDAGKAILHIYENEDFSKTIDFKSDDSPLTIADQKSHEVIDAALRALTPTIPILSEEGKEMGFDERKDWTEFWCVDPLDGTKEFIKKNGQFTVNIALIKDKKPVMGVIYTPVTDTTYYSDGETAFKEENGETVQIKVNNKAEKRIAVRSASHASEEEDVLLKQYDVVDTISKGSSLKFCMVAEGKADIYYRHGSTMEWDTAAGQAIVQGAGGVVLNPDKTDFNYNKEVLRNGSFLCLGF